MKFLAQLLTISALSLALADPISASELPAVKDPHLVDLLNNFEMLAETAGPPYMARVLRLREFGECDGTPQSCPQAILYIAVSTLGEDPDQKLYRFPKAYGWDFVEWKALPQKEGPNNFIVLELKKKVISKNLKEGWWTEQSIEVRVNPWKGYLTEIHPSQGGRERGAD